MKKSVFFLTILLGFLLCACGTSEATIATTVATEPVVIETTVPEITAQTEPIPETTEAIVEETEPMPEEPAQRITEGGGYYVVYDRQSADTNMVTLENLLLG